MSVEPVDISIFECKLDLRRTGGSLTIQAANDESELNPPSYEVRPNQSANDVYVDVLRKIADALENDKETVRLSVEDDHFIVKSASNALEAKSPAKRKTMAKTPKRPKRNRG